MKTIQPPITAFGSISKPQTPHHHKPLTKRKHEDQVHAGADASPRRKRSCHTSVEIFVDRSLESHPDVSEILDMYSAFLTTLTLHIAHHGLHLPVDCHLLGDAIARTWRRRRVDPRDLQYLLALHNQASPASAIQMHEYRRRTYLELTVRPDEQTALSRFRSMLLQKCQHFDLSTSILSQLCQSLQPLSIHPSVDKPLLAKGQHRLVELKTPKPRSALLETSGNANATPKDVKTRSADLKARLLSKQLYQSSLPQPLSREEQAKRYALQRIPEIALVIQSLALTGRRHQQGSNSFTMPTMAQNVQNSLRNPLARDEATRAIHLLGELAPEWIQVREFGQICGVTVRGAGLPKDMLAARVEKAMSAWHNPE